MKKIKLEQGTRNMLIQIEAEKQQLNKQKNLILTTILSQNNINTGYYELDQSAEYLVLKEEENGEELSNKKKTVKEKV